MTVGSASHAAGQTIVLDQSLKSLGTILVATIRVDDRALGEAATEQGHREGVAHQMLRHAGVHGPPHDRS